MSKMKNLRWDKIKFAKSKFFILNSHSRMRAMRVRMHSMGSNPLFFSGRRFHLNLNLSLSCCDQVWAWEVKSLGLAPEEWIPRFVWEPEKFSLPWQIKNEVMKWEKNSRINFLELLWGFWALVKDSEALGCFSGPRAIRILTKFPRSLPQFTF